MKRIYFDHNATTKPDDEVLEVLARASRDLFGNPSSIHSFGREAHRALDEAREDVARLINAADDEIIFESGGSEANNHAIRCAVEGLDSREVHIITTKIEHQAVLKACQWLEKRGCCATYLGVDEYGRVDPEEFRASLAPDTRIASIMLANNDVGTIQPLKEIIEIAHEHGVLVHSDAVQAVGKIPVDIRGLDVDFLTLCGHKLYGPRGVGALYVRHGIKLPSFVLGGRHENNRRAGTENVPALAAFGKACVIAKERLEERATRSTTLRSKLQEGILKRFPWARVNGHPVHRLPNTLNVSFPGYENDAVLMSLDLLGVCASGGAACSSNSREPSHVLMAMDRSLEESRGSLRFSVGDSNTPEDVDETLDKLGKVLASLGRTKAGI